MNYGMRFVTLYRRQGSRPSPIEKKCEKAKWLSGEALQIAVKRREAKSKDITLPTKFHLVKAMVFPVVV